MSAVPIGPVVLQQWSGKWYDVREYASQAEAVAWVRGYRKRRSDGNHLFRIVQMLCSQADIDDWNEHQLVEGVLRPSEATPALFRAKEPC